MKLNREIIFKLNFGDIEIADIKKKIEDTLKAFIEL